MTADLTKEALDALVSCFRAGACEPAERCRDMRASSGCHCAHAADAITALRAKVKALTARATASEAALAAAMEGAVRVKPLAWQDFGDYGAKACAMLNSSYMIMRWNGRGEYEVSVSVPGHGSAFDGERFHPTIEAAKAAAQSDYERRILAAIEPNPAVQDREALIEVLTARATAAEAALAAAMEGAVRVKPLEWFEVARGNNGYGKWEAEGYVVQKIEGLFLINFAGSYKNEWRFTSVGSAKAAAEADYNRRILAALEPYPAAQDREALIAATVERAAQAAYQWWDDDDAQDLRDHIRAIATQPQTDALEAVRREARAEGMRMAADLFTGSDLWEEAGIREWILAAAQTAADSVMGRA